MKATSINDLPYDILYIIFTLCWDKKYYRGDPTFPTLSSHVCRKWREQVLDIPAFWANLHFEDYTLQLTKHQTWLERSKSSPLHIVIGGPLFKHRSIKNMKEIMRLIIPYSDRWRTLRIFQVPDKVIRVVFDRLLNTPVPMLIKLEVSANYALRLKHRPFWFGGVPSLQNMILERISYDHIDARFASLTLLDILDPGMWVEGAVVIALKVHRILSVLPHLQSLRLRSYRSYPRYTDHDNTQSLGSYITSPLSHGSLVELSLGGPPRLRNVVISSLALPEVRYFVDRTRFYGDEWEIGLGICCLPVMEATQPFPNLISLRLAADNTRYNYKINPTDPRNSSNMRHLQGVLGGLKMLRSLTLDGMDLENQGHLNCLSRACPELRWLSLVCCIGYTLSELQSIIKLRKTLRATESLLRLAVFGVFDDLSAPSETAAKLWLDKEWNNEFVYRPGFRYSQKAKGDYLYDVHSLV